jgi:sialidase-1
MTHNSGADTEPEIIAGSSQGSRTVWLMTSDDDGRSWSRPTEITVSTKQPGWAWYATGPGAGIQTRTGRLVIPCDHITTGGGSAGSHIIFSDDHGSTWHIGGSPEGAATNECEVVERGDGRLLLNMRSHDRNCRHRFTATSDDGGVTWSPARPDPVLIEPMCQGSIRRFSQEQAGESPILFTNPASASDRVNLTVRLSDDDGDTWPVAWVIHAGPAAYSCLAVLDDGTIACLYECGEDHPYERISLARFDLNWLIGKRPHTQPRQSCR